MSRNARLDDVVRSLIAVVRDQQLTFLAAAIAYYAFVSVFPLTLVGLAIATAVAGESFAAEAVSLAGGLLTDQAATLLKDALTSNTGRGGATLVGLGFLLWSSLRVFRALDIAFSRVYGTETGITLRDQLRDALLAFAAIALALGVTVVLGTLVRFRFAPLANVLSTLFMFVTLTILFLPLYYVFPDCEMRFSAALPGAAVAAGGWVVLSTGFNIYAARATTFQLYGIIGAVLLALTWFYVGGLVLLLGAALNAVLAGQRDRQLQQEPGRGTTRPMSDVDEPPADEDYPEDDGERVSTVESEPVDQKDIAELRRELDRFEEEIEDRTVHREELEDDLQQYVRNRVRRGKARGWGPYLVLLYGTAMTLGAFYFLDGGWAILAMVVVWLSTLGLYTLMVLVGVTVGAVGFPGRLLDRLRNLR